MNKDPVSPLRLNPHLCPELERIVGKTLEKDRDLRYQSAAELRSDLKRLKRDTDTGRTIVSTSRVAKAPPDVSSTSGTEKRETRANKSYIAVAAGLVLVVLAADSLYMWSRRSPKLTDKDTVVLSEFDNRTGDLIFDGTLKPALAIDLEQTPFLSLLPDQRVRATLKLMNRPENERVTRDVALEICQRANSKAAIASAPNPPANQGHG